GGEAGRVPARARRDAGGARRLRATPRRPRQDAEAADGFGGGVERRAGGVSPPRNVRTDWHWEPNSAGTASRRSERTRVPSSQTRTASRTRGAYAPRSPLSASPSAFSSFFGCGRSALLTVSSSRSIANGLRM